ncbi:MAG: PhnD/SsuA/transferrin family substrate-binding protein [Phycisphaerae bacterium]|nr:PhnD/SsuA/transferrin family substrate-binding protein [Phycisphaerae bacterium]
MGRSRTSWLVLLTLAVAIRAPAVGQGQLAPVKIGVLAKRGPERCLEKWGPTAEYLTRTVPGHSFTIVPLAYEEIDAGVERGEMDFMLANPSFYVGGERGEVDFVLANSSFYVGLEKLYGANRIATLKNRRLGGVYTVFGGVIFRRADRDDIQRFDDLKGKTFMAVKETSLGGWYAAWRELKERRLDPHSDFADLRFGGTHDAVVYAVRDGKIDAGAVRTDTLERMAAEGKIRLEDFHALGHDHIGEEVCEFPFRHSTDMYPEWPMAKLAHTSNELAEKVAVALIGMPADCPAAKAARCAGWTVPLNYQPVHECLKELRVGPYKDYGKITFGDVLKRYWLWMMAGLAVTLASALRLLRQRKRAEAILRESKRHHRQIFEAATDGMLVFDPRGKIVEANPAACAMYGYDYDELIGLWGRDIVHRDCYHLFENFKTQLQSVGKFYAESTDVRKDGTPFDVEVRGSPVTIRGKPHLLAVVSDTTERKRAEEERECARRAAEAADRAKSEFLANMSHEIRTPMTAILGFADVLLEHGDLENAPPERIEAAQTIKKNGVYLLSIINDILDLSKIEAGKMTVERMACSPCQLVAEVTSLARVRADVKGLPLKFEYVGAIPETIQTDPTRLRQILINVIGNAIKFTEAGEVRLVTRFVADDHEPRLHFDVVDTGLGMTEEQVAKLFQPFTQADTSTTRKFGGTGLGLTISKRLAGLLGGNIAVVETQKGVGSRFRVSVATGPLDGVKMIADPLSATVLVPGQAKTTASTGRPALQVCRILLAEDGPDNQRLIAYVLEKAGAEVSVVENGKLAVDAALAARDRGEPFDVILMDMQMPVLDGYEATGQLRRNGYTAPIIALTAHTMAGDREKCLDAGCDDYASKPINRKKLIESVKAQLRAAVASHPM